MAIHVGDKLDPTVISRQLTRCASVVCAAPDYLARNGTPQRPDDLRQHNCLYHTRFGRVWRFQAPSVNGVDLVMDEVGVTGNFAANDSMVLLHAALAGEGIVHLPAFTTDPYLRTGALVRVLTDYALPELGVYALYCSRKYLPTSTRTLLDFLLNDLSSG
ncbi:substrate binding domain-containing protein [Pectobacterium polaris]|uniref:substrate binding domain-containing protein n=1 Tax=Pectobacterium polaris TaxID=2042057 RepID=UPI0021AF9FC2|nr:substrate binding domain-containing protein [Pectobacterium polaris]